MLAIELKENEEHKCVYDQIIIRKGEDPSFSTSVIRFYTDCSCEESIEKPLVTFHDSPFISAEDNASAWFSQIAPWFIQKGFKIKDLR